MATSLLTPDELSALAEGVMDGSIPVDTGFNTTARVKKHDLASEDSSLGVNITSIDMINERFIRTFRLGLVEMLRTSPKVNPNQVEIVRFGDYLKSLKAPLSVNDLKKTSRIMLMMRDSVGVNKRPGGKLPTPLPNPPKKLSSELKTTVGSMTTMELPRKGFMRTTLTDKGAFKLLR